MILIGILLILIGCLMVWFYIGYSPLKSTFKKEVACKINLFQEKTEKFCFTETDFKSMPVVIQKYLEHCGYIGSQRKEYLRIKYRNVNFIQGKKGPKLRMDYTQVNFGDKPHRLALIESSMFGIPFQGYDYYRDGIGGMKGVLAKGITLFHQTGSEMNKACLVTYLSESLFLPMSLLNGFISFEEMGDYCVKAMISYHGQNAAGIFRFNHEYEMTSFVTEDRAQIGNDGNVKYMKWTAECLNYKTYPDGIKRPERLRAIWNDSDEDFVYFDGEIYRVQ